jgi:hypothetical protein
MGLNVQPRRIRYSSLGETETIHDSERRSVEQLIAENERLQLLLVELLMKNEQLRIRLEVLSCY